MNVGDIVITPHASNGSTVAPAIVTRVWGPSCVNLTVMPDCGITFSKTSVMVFESREAAGAVLHACWPTEPV